MADRTARRLASRPRFSCRGRAGLHVVRAGGTSRQWSSRAVVSWLAASLSPSVVGLPGELRMSISVARTPHSAPATSIPAAPPKTRPPTNPRNEKSRVNGPLAANAAVTSAVADGIPTATKALMTLTHSARKRLILLSNCMALPLSGPEIRRHATRHA